MKTRRSRTLAGVVTTLCIFSSSGLLTSPAGAAARATEATGATSSQRYVVVMKTTFQPLGGLGRTASAAQEQAIAVQAVSVGRTVTSSGGKVVRTYRSVPALAVALTGAQRAALANDPRVSRIQPDYVGAAADVATPVLTAPAAQRPRAAADPLGGQLGTTIIGADTANRVGADGQGQTIAIVDSGVEATHTYLSGRIVGEACFATNTDSSGACPNGQTSQTGPGAGAPCSGSTDCYHGTHVAGIAAGANGDVGNLSYSGVAPKATIEPVNVFHIVSNATTCTNAGKTAPCALYNDSDLIAALDFIYNNRGSLPYASVNMSLGGSTLYTAACDSSNQGDADAIDNLYSAGIISAVASMNNGSTNGVAAPGCVGHAMTVGATANNDGVGAANDSIASFTNMGVPVDVLAPGNNIVSSIPGGSWVSYSGTSMATPEVAGGAIALLRQAVPGASTLFVEAAIKSTATGTLITDTRPGGLYTKPRLNIYNAYESHSVGGDDVVSGATPLPGASGTISGCSTAIRGTADNPAYFTKVAGEPDHAGNRGGASFWLKFVASGNGTASLDTFGSAFDTLLAVYDANDLTTAVSANDDSGNTPQSAVNFAMVAGHTYDVAVDGYRGLSANVAATGACVIHWNLSITRPPNDNEANATVLSGVSGTAFGTNAQATTEVGERSFENNAPQASVWWKWTAPETGPVVISTAGSSFDTRIATLLGALPEPNQVMITSNDDYGNSLQSRMSFYAVQGNTYYFDVDAFRILSIIPTGTIRIQWAQNGAANDDLASATVLSGPSGTTAGDSSRSTAEPGEPAPFGASDPIVTNWYQYTPTENGTLTLNLVDGNFDSYVGVYTGADVADLTFVGGNDNYYAQTLLSGVTIPVSAGTPYWIQVDGAPTLGFPGGSYTLEWGLNPPANDSFFAATNLPGSAGQVTSDNTRATGEPTEGYTVVPNWPLATEWWSWTAPSDGVVTFSTYGSDFDTGLAAWAGNIGGLGRIASDDNGGPDGFSSVISFSATAGTRYLISVDGMAGARGNIALSYSEPQPPVVSIGDVSVVEGDGANASVSFPVRLSAPSAVPVTVQYSTADGTAQSAAPADYVPKPLQTLQLPAGATGANITVTVKGDRRPEPNETFTVNLTSPTGGATLGRTIGTATIIDNDAAAPPAMSIGDTSVVEGNSGTANATFDVTLDHASAATVTVPWSTGGGTATAGTDYTTASGTLSFPAGTTSKTVAVVVKGDTTVEPSETANVNLGVPAGATIADGSGRLTIVNDDAGAANAIGIGDVSVPEGNASNHNATFTIRLANVAPVGGVTVHYATAPGTATAATDYATKTGIAAIAAGAYSTTVAVPVVADGLHEANETFTVTLSAPTGGATLGRAVGTGTIVDDDPARSVLAVGEGRAVEGNAGNATVLVPITLTQPSATAITVRVSTANGTAIGSDYTPFTNRLVTFAAGITSVNVAVVVKGDAVIEPDENFTLTLTSPTGATIGRGAGTYTILNDD